MLSLVLTVFLCKIIFDSKVGEREDNDEFRP